MATRPARRDQASVAKGPRRAEARLARRGQVLTDLRKMAGRELLRERLLVGIGLLAVTVLLSVTTKGPGPGPQAVLVVLATLILALNGWWKTAVVWVGIGIV